MEERPVLINSAANGLFDLPGDVISTSAELSEYRASVNDAYYPARMEMLGSETRLSNPRLSAVRLHHLTVGVVRFGADVLIDPGDLGAYHVNIPVSGTVVAQCGTRSTVATPANAAVFSPNMHTILPMWHADATQICIKIERAVLEGELSVILGRPVDTRVDFDLGFDMTSTEGRQWLSTLQLLLSTLTTSAGKSPAMTVQLTYIERSLIAGLIAHQRNSMSDAIDRASGVVHPRVIKRVVDAIDEAPGAQYTLPDLAAISGVGVRRLQKLFDHHLDMSPSEYLRGVRLDRAHADLLSGTEDLSVSEVAFRWGFNHLGRFAQHYQHKFGETPSQTLRSRR